MRKISDEDYRDVASTYRARAVRVMRQLDEAGGDFRKLVEQDAAARRLARGSGAQPPVVYREPEAPPAPEPAAAPASPVAAATVPTAPAAVPTAPATGSAAPVSAVPGRRLCAACAADNDPDAVFCKKCGKAIQAAAEGGR
jgi:hypothetical protein